MPCLLLNQLLCCLRKCYNHPEQLFKKKSNKVSVSTHFLTIVLLLHSVTITYYFKLVFLLTLIQILPQVYRDCTMGMRNCFGLEFCTEITQNETWLILLTEEN